MSDPIQITEARKMLADYRISIDNIDAALIHMLAERFRCTKAVGVLKAEHGLPPADPARDRRQSRSRFRGEIPELRHQGSDPAPRTDRR